jgi:hypothetical protein
LCKKNLYSEFYRSDGPTSEKTLTLGQTRLNQVTGTCCMIMLLCTMQLPSSSFSQRKALLFFNIPPYLPYLVPVNYFLFIKVKFELKGRHFDTILDIKNNVTSELKEYSGRWVLWWQSEALGSCQ